jgi:hypothetical protein
MHAIHFIENIRILRNIRSHREYQLSEEEYEYPSIYDECNDSNRAGIYDEI